MTPAHPGTPAYRNIARRLAEALERQATRLSHSDDDEPQPQRKSAAKRRRSRTARSREHKVKVSQS